jgi:AraC-like DNA-binding protein
MSLSDTRRADEIQREFFSRLGDAGQLLQLVDALHGIHYFIKDHHCRHIAVSQKFAERLGLHSASEMIGRTNYEFYPKLIADKFAIDDHHILSTGEPLLNIVEMLPSACGGFDWITTNKMPIFDAKGRVIGIMGTLQSHGDYFRPWAQGAGVGKAAEYIQAHFREPVDLKHLMKAAGLSQRHLNRKFHEVFGMSAQDFWINTRIQRSCDALTGTSKNIAEIAQEFGFCDQSAFSRQFRQRTGLSPLEYRRRYAPPRRG